MGRAGKQAVTELIRSVPLFASCSKRELSLLAGIAEEATYNDGDELITEGEAGVGLQVIMEGQTVVSVGGSEKRRLGPGDFVGEIALLDGGPRSATVAASGEVTALSIPAWSFNAVLKAEPELALKMLKELARRLRSAE